ncbi:peptidoglycan-binding domain-containing protein [Ruegeria atlantica]|nr:peptidoglycan-binding protein [Ruegeria atlantica]
MDDLADNDYDTGITLNPVCSHKLSGGSDMLKFSITTIFAASLTLTVPVATNADTKDVIIGAGAGALLYKLIDDNQKAKKQQQATRQYRPSKRNSGVAAAPSLNSQYTRAERIQIQSAFRDLGYSIGAVDGVLGKNSRAVIRQFQASSGEAATGQLTRPQYVALLSQVPGVNPVYARRELTRDEVMMLQQGLQALGYYPGAIDGAQGRGTLGAQSAFLAQNGTNLTIVTPVQSLVMVRTTAGLPTPPYLQREAGSQITPAQPFGTQQAGFGTAGQQPMNPFDAQSAQQPAQGFATQGQQLANPFGTPNEQQPVYPNTAPVQQQQQLYAAPQQKPAATQPAATTTMFGAPSQQPQTQPGAAPGGVVPATNQQNLFAPTTPQQQAPQPVVPQGDQSNTLFATGGGTPVVTQPVTQQRTSQSNLDIFSGTVPALTAPQTDQMAVQTQPVTSGN